jgi:hypothetical protein
MQNENIPDNVAATFFVKNVTKMLFIKLSVKKPSEISVIIPLKKQ